jgi:hypothetical protein
MDPSTMKANRSKQLCSLVMMPPNVIFDIAKTCCQLWLAIAVLMQPWSKNLNVAAAIMWQILMFKGCPVIIIFHIYRTRTAIANISLLIPCAEFK